MYYVYLIQSSANPSKTYIGYTTNLKQRLETHKIPVAATTYC
ncbi:TPA: hypothetical protein DEG75_02465 [Candidatus Dependentiae bacterium]|nr:hypothetical protein [Candidatus Dependentiae bacterium]